MWLRLQNVYYWFLFKIGWLKSGEPVLDELEKIRGSLRGIYEADNNTEKDGRA